MTEARLLTLLKANLRLRLHFQQYVYGGENELKVEIYFGDTKIAEDDVTINPTGRY